MGSVPTIESYLDSLVELIRRWGVSSAYVSEARDNVGTQIYSFLAHWADVKFRNALLVIGEEEGNYYKPYTPINPFIVLTVRNSVLENLHSVHYARTGLKKNIGPAEIKRVTQQAIRHFEMVNFDVLCGEVSIPAHIDYYGGLPEKYPIAWEALCQLGNSDDTVITYQAVVQDKEPIYRHWEPTAYAQKGATSLEKTVFDGYSRMIDAKLKEHLSSIRNGEVDCLYVDSFKMLTRNIEKFLYVVNDVLASGGAFFTANYYFTNGYIERRSICLQPIHSAENPFSSTRKRQVLTGGVERAHENALRSMFD